VKWDPYRKKEGKTKPDRKKRSHQRGLWKKESEVDKTLKESTVEGKKGKPGRGPDVSGHLLRGCDSERRQGGLLRRKGGRSNKKKYHERRPLKQKKGALLSGYGLLGEKGYQNEKVERGWGIGEGPEKLCATLMES